MDLKTGQISDYGFAIQPLIHRLKEKNYLIGGRYQMQVYRGSMPKALIITSQQSTRRPEDTPRHVFKQLVSSNSIKPLA